LLDSNAKIEKGEVLFCDNGETIDLTKIDETQIRKVRGNKISVVFQEPMTALNPVLSIKKQLLEPFQIHRQMTKKQAFNASLVMLDEVQIPNKERVLKGYPHQLSGGMRQRVMIAMALACKPKILIADEPTTALDVTVQAQILRLMKNLQKENGTAILLITHDLGVVRETADDVAVVYLGRVVEHAPVTRIFILLHPVNSAISFSSSRRFSEIMLYDPIGTICLVFNSLILSDITLYIRIQSLPFLHIIIDIGISSYLIISLFL
jgi:peptide/nickel transport system ATP-binding protein